MDRASLLAADRKARATLRTLDICDVLLIAPPGCGKTEGLADRAASLIERGLVAAPQRILGLTFSNRARDNLNERIGKRLPSHRRRVTVTNLHGLASRLIRAHGQLLGLDIGLLWPQRGWRASLWNDIVGGNRDRRDRAETVLRRVKALPLDDYQVRDALNAEGNEDALEFERKRLEAGRLDFQDLLRHAQRLLQLPRVRHVYRLHFGAVLLDEAQDLTSQQLDIALALGEGRMTAAADLEQGIYTFTGANAPEILERLRALGPVELQLHRSFRSADAVLHCVNVLNAEDAVPLVGAEPGKWPDPGIVAVARCSTKEEEAANVIDCLARMVATNGNMTIGIMSRDRYRRAHLIEALPLAGITHAVWDRPTDNPVLGRILKGCLAGIGDEGLDAEQRLFKLIQLARDEIDPTDADLLDELEEAKMALLDMLPQLTLEEAVNRCRRDSSTEPVSPGVNILTGHEGKGQQFDWVFVLGVERGTIPHYRATTDAEVAEERRLLRVMASRARYGLVFTFVGGWNNQYGNWKKQIESPWLALVDAVTTHSWEEALAASSPAARAIATASSGTK